MLQSSLRKREIMTKIKRYIEEINEELESAKDYAEQYVEYKAKSNSYWATRFKEMVMDELKHAEYIHDLAVSEIEEIKTVYMPPVEMQEKWDKCHAKYVEKIAWIKQML